MCELLNLYWDEGKDEGRNEGRVNMLLSYLKNSPNTNPMTQKKPLNFWVQLKKRLLKQKNFFLYLKKNQASATISQ